MKQPPGRDATGATQLPTLPANISRRAAFHQLRRILSHCCLISGWYVNAHKNTVHAMALGTVFDVACILLVAVAFTGLILRRYKWGLRVAAGAIVLCIAIFAAVPAVRHDFFDGFVDGLTNVLANVGGAP